VQVNFLNLKNDSANKTLLAAKQLLLRE